MGRLSADEPMPGGWVISRRGQDGSAEVLSKRDMPYVVVRSRHSAKRARWEVWHSGVLAVLDGLGRARLWSSAARAAWGAERLEVENRARAVAEMEQRQTEKKEATR